MERIIYKVIKDFEPRLPDELKLSKDNLIELISNDDGYDDGWYMGKNLSLQDMSISNVGLFPKIYVELVDMSSYSTPNTNDLITPKFQTPPNIANPNNISNGSPINNNTASSISTPPPPQLLRSRSRRVTSNGSPMVINPNLSTPNNSNQLPNLNRMSSVHKTMNDIDNALKELNVNDSQTSINSFKNNYSNIMGNNHVLNAPIDPSTVAEWSPEEVTQYFSVLGFDMEYAGKFARHKISGSILLELTLADLKELDIDSFGTRFELFKEIKELQLTAKNISNPIKKRNSIRINSPSSINSRYSGIYTHSRKKSQSLDDLSSTSHLHDDSTTITPYSNGTYHTADTSGGSGSTSNSHNLNNNSYKSLRPLSVIVTGTNNNSSHGFSSLNSTASPSPVLDGLPPNTVVEEEREIDAIDELNENENDEETNNVSNTPKAAVPEGLFESPRRAPQPPNFQSPLMNENFKFGSGSVNNGGNISGKRHSFIEATSSSAHKSHSRGSSIGQSSSIYNNSNHARTNSSLSFAPSRHSHFRNTSDLSVIHHGNNNNNNSSTTNNTNNTKSHRRYSSLLSYNAAAREDVYTNNNNNTNRSPSRSPSRKTSKSVAAHAATAAATKLTNTNNTILASPERRSISAKEISSPKINDGKNRTVSAVIPSATSNNSAAASSKDSGLKMLTARKKTQTSAFQEGLRTISAKESMKTAEFSGWMSKRGNLTIGTWKKRFFTLHKTRLSYFTSMSDKTEKGLIDITSHRVLPAIETEDRISAVYAASTGSGRYCFKLVPPAPGSRKGLTFTQQKVHYFAVESKDEMRKWMAALMKATIELDESVPVISSCVTPTIPLIKAQELAANQKEIDLKNPKYLGMPESEDEDLLYDETTDLYLNSKTPLQLDTSNAVLTNVPSSGNSSNVSTPMSVNTPTLSIKKSTTITKATVPMITKFDTIKTNETTDVDSEVTVKSPTSANGSRISSSSSALGSAVSLGKRVMSLRKN